MNAFAKVIAAAVIAGLSGSALAATTPSKESIEKSALAAHEGMVSLSKQIKKEGKNVWEVQVQGKDGAQYTMYFDAKTGKNVTFPEQRPSDESEAAGYDIE